MEHTPWEDDHDIDEADCDSMEDETVVQDGPWKFCIQDKMDCSSIPHNIATEELELEANKCYLVSTKEWNFVLVFP